MEQWRKGGKKKKEGDGKEIERQNKEDRMEAGEERTKRRKAGIS